MKFIYYTLLVTAITLSSCKNNEEQATRVDPRTIVPFTQQGATALQAQGTQQDAPQSHNLFHENNTGGVPSVVAGVNPAHGQPNHRCDIAVGAPLNSAANGAPIAPQSNQVQVQPQMQAVTQTATNKTITPKGMNPPHGEKNHRCDIPVGASLSSKPTPTTVSTPAAPASGEITKDITVQQPVPTLLSPSAANNVETPPGMNPPHGQAGHRCDVSVGAALPKS